MTDKKRRGFFEDEIVGVECQKAFHQLLVFARKKVVNKYLPPQNTQRIRHGGDWRHPGLPNAVEGGLQQHSSMVEIRFEDLAKHDLGVIERVVQQLSNDMEQQFLGMMFATVGTACEQTGNTVDAASAGSTEEAFAQMLEKIEFSADKKGNVSLPEIHTGPEAFARLSEALGNAPQSFHQRIEEIKARKIADAIKREEERKARFARYGDDA